MYPGKEQAELDMQSVQRACAAQPEGSGEPHVASALEGLPVDECLCLWQQQLVCTLLQ